MLATSMPEERPLLGSADTGGRHDREDTYDRQYAREAGTRGRRTYRLSAFPARSNACEETYRSG